MAIAEEGVGVGHAVVGAARDAEHGLAAPKVVEGETKSVDLEAVESGDELGRVVFVVSVPRPAGQPEPVVAALGRPEGCEREHVGWVNVLALAQSLEHGTARELLRRVTQHRPVCDLARRRAAGADRVQDTAGAGCGEPVEVRGDGDLIGRASAERSVRAVGEPVEQDDDDGMHPAKLTGNRHGFGAAPLHTRTEFLVTVAVGRRLGVPLKGCG